MKIALLGCGIIFLSSLIACAQIPSDANLRLQISHLSATNFSGIISNTHPEVQYEVEYQESRTNRISLGVVYVPESSNWVAFDFRTTNVIDSKKIRIRSWEDNDGNGIADWWELRHFGTTGIDPYGNPMGDGISNYQKYQSGMDPFDWQKPRGPEGNLSFRSGSDISHENSLLTWHCDNVSTLDFFVIERATRTLRPMTNNNWNPRRIATNGQPFIRRPPSFVPGNFRPGSPPPDPFITGPYQIIAKVPAQPNVWEYHYVDTNQNAFPPPLYNVRAHFAVPAEFPKLKQVTAEVIRKTMLTVTVKPTANGYDLTIPRFAFHVRYLLLMRDKNDPQWRASGYFVSGTNSSPVHLHVDKKGMMSDGQNPIAIPPAKFLPDAVQPEFVAGYGEDSDGDYLPDIYEVLVTHTDPDDADTGDTGVVDGLKSMTGDGVSNFEKFCCRIDPSHAASPPAPIELKHPTGRQIFESLTPATDLNCELQMEVRTNEATGYRAVEQVPWLFPKIISYKNATERKDFDVRISWRFTGDFLTKRGYQGLPTEYRAIQPLMDKMTLASFSRFQADLEANPPTSPAALSNKMQEVAQSYRDGGMEKGLAMTETVLLENYHPQDFYGKVVDQDGHPLAGATVTATLTKETGYYGPQKYTPYTAKSDSRGLFQFTGIYGSHFGAQVGKDGYDFEGKNQTCKGPAGPKTTPDDRAVYTLWSTNIHEKLITGGKSFEIVPDGRPYFINLTDGTISENQGGDLKVWVQYTNQVVNGLRADWAAGIEVVQGGLWEVPQASINSGFVEELSYQFFSAPSDSYTPSFNLKKQIKGGQRGEIGTRYFYLRLRDGKEYGKIAINLFAPYGRLHPGWIQFSYAINPSGSRILR